MNKEISLKSFIIVLVLLILLELIIMIVIVPALKYKKLQPYCDLNVAVCNESNTICYNYELEDDTTIVTWKGDCSKYYKFPFRNIFFK